jgi:cold shock CspA family protein
VIGRIKARRNTFGFIKADDGRDFFFHDDDLTDDFDIREGDVVTFDAVDPQPALGPRACAIALREAQQ